MPECGARLWIGVEGEENEILIELALIASYP